MSRVGYSAQQCKVSRLLYSRLPDSAAVAVFLLALKNPSELHNLIAAAAEVAMQDGVLRDLPTMGGRP